MDDDKEFREALEFFAIQLDKPEVKDWLAIRKQAGEKIDPQTAVIFTMYVQVLDPYGVCKYFPPELSCIGPLAFVRSLESDIWICEYDLPESTRSALGTIKLDVGNLNDDFPF